jgi:phosphatidylglycerol:prolipoprotein diacylglycerol transferase
VFLWAARRRGISSEGVWTVVAIGFVCAVLCAKLAQMIAEGWPTNVPLEAGIDPRVGGRSLLGGLVGGWLGVEIAKRYYGLKRSTGDMFALALPAGEAVGRIGCYLNGCCYGSEYRGIGAIWQHGAWRYPAQLYSSAVALSLFCLLLRLFLRGGLPEGRLFTLYLLGFGLTRFGLEFIRWRESVVFGLSPMQWFCMDLVLYSAVVLTLKRPVRQPIPPGAIS